MLPLTCLPDALLKFLDLGLPGPALDEQMVTRLSFAAVAPTLIGPYCRRNVGQIEPIAARLDLFKRFSKYRRSLLPLVKQTPKYRLRNTNSLCVSVG